MAIVGMNKIVIFFVITFTLTLPPVIYGQIGEGEVGPLKMNMWIIEDVDTEGARLKMNMDVGLINRHFVTEF